MPNTPIDNLSGSTFSSYQKGVVAILAFLQFTIILDFMILSPLGAMLMPALKISTSEFGLVVSAYAFSAGASGFLAGGFADRFDRKRLLMFFYCGFILGTLLCGLAPTYPLLLAARMVTGIFGGVIGSIVFAITTDLFPMSMRGRVMGVIQTAFAGSQILGIPLGLFFANHWGWHAPFIMIVVVSSLAGIAIALYLKPIDAHLGAHPKRNPFKHLFDTVTNPHYLLPFTTTALLSTGGFMLMPFGSAFSVNNLGISLEQLPVVYMATGLSSIIAGPMIGRLADKLGKFKVFLGGSILSIVMILIYTRLGPSTVATLIIVSIIMFVGISARMISCQALMSAVPEPHSRGSFMSVSSSIQQVAGGLASVLAGLIVVQHEHGPLEHFDRLGYVVSTAIVITVVALYFVDQGISSRARASIGAPVGLGH